MSHVYCHVLRDILLFFFSFARHHRALHSFPTRRSSDLLNIEPLNGERGEILDKDGEQLAFNGMKETVGYTAGSTDEEDILSLSDELEMSEESLGNLFDQEWISDGMFVPIKDAHRFTEKEKQKFSENGLSVTESPAREYALDNATYHLRSEEHTSELQSRGHLVCRLLLEKKKIYI